MNFYARAVTRGAHLFGKRTPCVTSRVRVLLVEYTYSGGSLNFAGNLLPPCGPALSLGLARAQAFANARSANFTQSAHVPARNYRTTNVSWRCFKLADAEESLGAADGRSREWECAQGNRSRTRLEYPTKFRHWVEKRGTRNPDNMLITILLPIFSYNNVMICYCDGCNK